MQYCLSLIGAVSFSVVEPVSVDQAPNSITDFVKKTLGEIVQNAETSTQHRTKVLDYYMRRKLTLLLPYN